MPRGGPIPKPTTLKVLDGTRDSRINHCEPRPGDGELTPPADMGEEALDVWEFTAPCLATMGISNRVDSDVFRAYCEAVVNHREATRDVRARGILVEGVYGNSVKNPALNIQTQAANVMRAFAQEFGLTPSARTRIEVSESGDGETNPFAATG